MTYPASNPVKELRLYVSGERQLPSIPLFIQDNVNFNFSSNYSKIFEAGNDAVDFLGSIAKNVSAGVTGGKLNLGFSSQNKFFGFQQWKGSDPVTFTMTINFHMGLTKANSGFTDVYEPIMGLVALALPYEDPAGILLPPSGQLLDLLIKVGQKDSSAIVNTALEEHSATAKNFSESSQEFAQKYASSFISIRVGNMAFLPWAVVKKAEPSFGKEFDSDGFPITGTITLEMSSAFVATKSLINYWMNSATQESLAQSIESGKLRLPGVSPQTAWSSAFKGNALDGGATKWSTGGN